MTCRPRAAPTNQGAARADVERTWRKPKLTSTVWASIRSKTRRTVGTDDALSPR